MRQRIKARELWLFAPILLIMAGAFYWMRVERVSKPGAGAMFVSDFQFQPATGYWREKGYSHEVKVTVSHRSPHPKWWGKNFGMHLNLDPLQPEKESLLPGSYPRDKYVAVGAVLTVEQNGKTVPGGLKQLSIPYDNRFDGENYVFEHHVKTSEIPPSLGAVTFRGLYRIADGDLVPVERVIRKVGQTLPTPQPARARVRLKRAEATPFFPSSNINATGKTTVTHQCWVRLTFDDEGMRPDAGRKRSTLVYGIELRDEAGQILRPGTTPGFEQGMMMAQDRQVLGTNERDYEVSLKLAPTLQTKGRLTMRGKVSLDRRAPVSFAVQLPPREAMAKAVEETDTFSEKLRIEAR